MAHFAVASFTFLVIFAANDQAVCRRLDDDFVILQIVFGSGGADDMDFGGIAVRGFDLDSAVDAADIYLGSRRELIGLVDLFFFLKVVRVIVIAVLVALPRRVERLPRER